MENCKHCFLYDEVYDALRQRGNDVIKLSEEGREKHYCIVYEEGIPEPVADDTEICRKHEPLTDQNR